MTLDYRSIIDGRRKGPLAVVARGLLRLAAVPYGIGVRVRNRGYDSGHRETFAVDAPVISIGNLTTGGTGKTPIVCALARGLRERGVRVAIVSRGYGRGDADFNDEALELHDRLPDVPHVQDADRVAAAKIAVEELAAEVVLVDDGFQHRRLRRDVNVVVIDASCPFGHGHLLPRGLLREPLTGLRRADLAILTRCDAVESDQLTNIQQQLSRIHPSLPIIHSVHRPMALRQHPDRTCSIDELAGSRVAVLSAIGNPQAFERTVRDCGAEIVATHRLPDHDPYHPETMATIRQWVQSLGQSIDQVVCTHKDLVKLRTDRLGGKPLHAIQIELQVQQGQALLDQMLDFTASKTQIAGQSSEP